MARINWELTTAASIGEWQEWGNAAAEIRGTGTFGGGTVTFYRNTTPVDSGEEVWDPSGDLDYTTITALRADPAAGFYRPKLTGSTGAGVSISFNEI